MSLDTSKIKQVPMKESQYIKEVTEKKQIVLHHTAGNSSGVGTIKMWDADDRGRIATCVTISGKGQSKDTYDGEICQAFSSKYWGYHLGLKPDVFRAKGVPYKALDKHAIGIEICSWGPLDKVNGKFYNYVDREVPADQVTELNTPYKGYKFYHRYTDAQIESVKNFSFSALRVKLWSVNSIFKVFNINHSISLVLQKLNRGLVCCIEIWWKCNGSNF